MQHSGGGWYPHDEREALFGMDPSKAEGSCVWPSKSEVQSLADALSDSGAGAVVSIGAGVGLLEGLLKKVGVNVTAVDLETEGGDPFAYSNTACFCGDIARIPHHTLFNINGLRSSDNGVALLICFGKRIPLFKYIDAFPNIQVVAIVGDLDGITSPGSDALRGVAGWEEVRSFDVTAVMKVECTVYRRAVPSSANDFLKLWASGRSDSQAHTELGRILARTPLSGRMIHGKPGPRFGQRLSTDEWKRLSWVFGPDALPSFLGKSPRDICLLLGFGKTWLDKKVKSGTAFKLVVFPSAQVDAEVATWSGLGRLLKKIYPEAWAAKIEPHFSAITSMTQAEIEAEAGYSMGAVNLVGRQDVVTGESNDPRYMSLQRLLARESSRVVRCPNQGRRRCHSLIAFPKKPRLNHRALHLREMTGPKAADHSRFTTFLTGGSSIFMGRDWSKGSL